MVTRSKQCNSRSNFSQDGEDTSDDFYLVVSLEDTTPDATPPSVTHDGHYTDVTSYVAGERTLFLSLLDTNNPVDTTATDGPKTALQHRRR